MSMRVVLLSLLTAVLVVTMGCGVPSSEAPEPLAPDLAAIGEVPERVEPTTGVTRVGIAWIRGRKLQVVDRPVDAEGRLERVNVALDALVSGTLPVAEEAGLVSLVPSDAVLDAGLSGRRATVALDLGSGESDPLAIGQVAMTVLAVKGVQSVEFTVNGRKTDVPLPSGEVSDGPVTVRDYADVLLE
jgi:hypothetical protein